MERNPYDVVSLLFGCETFYKNCPAYCKRHGKYLTAKQMRRKWCLAKSCRHLRKIDTHGYWEERRRKRGERKERSREVVNHLFQQRD